MFYILHENICLRTNKANQYFAVESNEWRVFKLATCLLQAIIIYYHNQSIILILLSNLTNLNKYC